MTYSPLLEWIMAGAWANYKTHEFLGLDGELQSVVVAAYQTYNQIEAVLANEHAKEMRRKSKPKGKHS